MTMNETMKKLQGELEAMRTRLDQLRVKGSLGKMELRDKLTEYKGALEPAYQKAKSKISELSRSGTEESKALAKSLVAGWDELHRTHKQLSEESERERKGAQETKRKAD